jgi:outer membrane protein
MIIYKGFQFLKQRFMLCFRNKTGRAMEWFGTLGWKQLAGVILLLVSGLNAAAQQTWSLSDCLDFSRKNNLVIQQQDFERVKYRLQLKTAKKKFLPVVDSRFRSASNWGFLIDPTTNVLDRKFNLGNQVSLNASWDLFNGAASGHQTRVASQELKAAEYAYESAVNHAALEIAYLYLQVLLSTEQVQSAGQRTEQLQNQQNQVSRQVANGIGSKRDLLNVQSLLAAEELNGILAANNYEKACFTLMQTMGLRQDSLIRLAPVVVADSLLAAGNTAVNLLAASEAHFPEVKAAQARVEAAKANVLLVRSSKLPVLSLSSQLGSRTSSSQDAEFNRQLKENFNQQLGLNLTIPLFNNNLTQINIELARLETESAKIAYRQTQEELRQRILAAALDYKAAYRQYVAARRGYEALKEEYRFADKQLALGLINALAFGEVRSRYFGAQSGLLQNKYDCLFKWKILAYYQGEPLD